MPNEYSYHLDENRASTQDYSPQALMSKCFFLMLLYFDSQSCLMGLISQHCHEPFLHTFCTDGSIILFTAPITWGYMRVMNEWTQPVQLLPCISSCGWQHTLSAIVVGTGIYQTRQGFFTYQHFFYWCFSAHCKSVLVYGGQEGHPFEVICCCSPTGKHLKRYVFWNWSSYPTTVVWFWLLYCGLVITHCVLTAWATWHVLFIYQDAASYITNALMRCLVPVHVHLEDCSFRKS